MLAVAGARRSGAQATTSLLPDATVLPSRAIGFRVLSSWTRADELLGNGGLRNLAWSLNTDSLLVSRVPSLAPAQAAIAGAAGLPNFRLTAGQLLAVADSRVVTAPLIIQYGLTSKLTLGVVVPLVETRTTLVAQLNPTLGRANVGPNPALVNASALAGNNALVQSFRSAATTLQQRLTQCQASPGDSGCATLLAQPSVVQAAIQSARGLATELETLYGTDADTHPGQAFVPIATDSIQARINTQIATLHTQFTTLLNSDVINGQVTGAGGPAARAQLQALLASLGRDSLQSPDRTSIGDISVGATYQVVNTFGDTTPNRGTRYRLAVNGTFRIATGQPANSNRFFDNGTGDGQSGVEVSGAGDIQLAGRLSASATASYTAQLGSVDVARIPFAANGVLPLDLPIAGTYSAGNVLALSIAPRYRVAGYFSLNGQYSMIRTGADQYSGTPYIPTGDPALQNSVPPPPPGLAAATAQQVGFGFSYSTIVGPARGPGALPFEVAFSHLETMAGSGGPVRKTFRDQIELRVFLVR